MPNANRNFIFGSHPAVDPPFLQAPQPGVQEMYLVDVDELTHDPDVAAFEECFSRPGAYAEFIMTLPFRQTDQERSAETDSNLFGTRAKSTERLVYRILQSPEYRTLEIVTRFLEAAL